MNHLNSLFNPKILIFSKEWFESNQKLFLKFTNTWIGRKILKIDGNKSEVGKNKVTKIIPNAIFWEEGQHNKAEFRTHPKFAKRLFHAFKPVWFLVHLWDTLFANNFRPDLNLGFDIFPDVFSNAGGDGAIRNHGGASFTWE